MLDEFFRTGRYGARRSCEVLATRRPSMDIAKASNFQRYAFDLIGRDPDVPAGYANPEQRVRRFDVLDAVAQALKAYIAARCAV